MNRSDRRIRVAVCATHPIQYQAPLWRALAARPGLQVHVFFGSDLSVRGYRDREFGVDVKWDVPLTAGYEHTFLSRDPTLQHLTFRRPRARGLARALGEFGADVALVNAYNGLFWVDCILTARLLGIPLVMRHEASDVAMQRSPLQSGIRDALLRVLYAQISVFAAIGTEARRHLRRLGVPASRIGSAPYCVDTDMLEKQVQEWRPRRQEVRMSLGIAPEDFVLLFSGKLIEKKQPLLIPEAVRRLPPALQKRMHLIVVGDGEQRAEMEAASRAVFGARLHLAGFVNQSELGRWYTAADCLVLPSKRGAGETWGLVVNEALQFGIPAIVSDGVGCGADLVGSKTGAVFCSESAVSFSDAMFRLMDQATKYETTLQEHCWQKVSEFSLAVATAGLAETFGSVRNRTENSMIL